MSKKDYEKNNDYQKSLKILRGFIKDVLDGDIENLRDFDFKNLTLKTYVGNISDPDMYLITQAIYIILWGELYDLSFKKMGRWNSKNEYAFRGDTLNSFGSLIGNEDKNSSFAFRAKYFDADKKPELWGKIEEFYELYHNVGNFLVIPNRGTVKNGINGARGRYFNKRDYFDWFLLAVSEYQTKVKRGDIYLSKFERQLQMNLEYDPEFMTIEEWASQFFLEPYFRDGKPVLIYKTPLKDRLKKTASNGKCLGSSYYKADEYLELLEDYLDKSKEVIRYRTGRIIEVLKEKGMEVYDDGIA